MRVSNKGAHAFYEQLGLKNIGKRPRYYSDKEDAFIYTGPLPIAEHDVAGMDLRINAAATKIETTGTTPSELILAIESSCDETAVALLMAMELFSPMLLLRRLIFTLALVE